MLQPSSFSFLTPSGVHTFTEADTTSNICALDRKKKKKEKATVMKKRRLIK